MQLKLSHPDVCNSVCSTSFDIEIYNNTEISWTGFPDTDPLLATVWREGFASKVVERTKTEQSEAPATMSPTLAAVLRKEPITSCLPT